MNRPRDRASAAGLLPRMEARPRKDGLVTYRYHPVGAKPIHLGTDRLAAIQQVLDMLGIGNDVGTVKRLWAQYKDSPSWQALAIRTRADYEEYSTPLLGVFGDMRAAAVTAPMVARYLRTERAAAPKRANREISLLGNLIGLAIERGEAEHNPCRGGQVKRNPERPRANAPATAQIEALAAFANAKGGQWRMMALAARFAAAAGSRQMEMLPLHWPQFGTDKVRLNRGKQRAGTRKVESVDVGPELLAVRAELQELAADPRIGAVFPTRKGVPYTSSGFASNWQKLMVEAIEKGVVDQRFTFHDLRAHYTSEHKALHKTLPDLHASPTTTATVYERSKVARRQSL